MDNDDRQIGHILTRREALKLLGAAGATLLVACGPQQSGTGATTQAPTVTTAIPGANETAVVEVPTTAAGNAASVPACVVRPEATEGPYYVDEDLVRSDIRSDPATGAVKEGTPLILTFNVSRIGNGSCTPLQGATVDIWHCDAAGQYSDVSDPGFDTSGQKWLRGSQVTDANGVATFTTIYPGWYAGRAIHIHFKVHPDETKEFTSQLFFDDALSDQVLSRAPYASKGQRDMLNSTDNIYQDLLLLTTSQSGQGYAATFPIGLDLATIGTGQSGGPQGPGGGPPPNGTRQPGG